MNEKALDYLKELQEIFLATREVLEEEEALQLIVPIFDVELAALEKTITHLEENRFLALAYYYAFPEVFTAMDIHWFSTAVSILDGWLVVFNDSLMEDLLAEVDQCPLPNYVCTLHKMFNVRLFSGRVPIPSINTRVFFPCDGGRATMDSFMLDKDWKNVPTFDLDAPYKNNDVAKQYYAGELRRFIEFLERHSGRKYDESKLRAVVEETNKQYELLMEINELNRSTPAPFGSFSGFFPWHMVQNNPISNGSPETTRFLETWYDYGKTRLERDRAELEEAERIRLLWIDGPPFWGMELNTLLKEEFGAKIVMDMNAYISASALIDTSTEQSMFEGLASRNTYNPIMVNVVQNTIVELLERIERIVEAYKIDCVIGPGHMGHKDCSASLGMITDTCRRIGVPILNYKFDLFDPRYTTIDEMKVIFSTFFDAMGLG